MLRTEIEGDAIAVYKEAGLEPDEPASMAGLARLLLRTPVKAVSMRGRAELTLVGDEWRIYVRRGTPAARLRFEIAHELAHWWFRRVGYPTEDRETCCDALGAAIVAPRPLYLAVRKRTIQVPEVAGAIGATQSLVALREGEVLGTPVALVEDRRVLVRGEEWGWPPEQEIRRIARVGGRPGLARIRITDEGRRVALVADPNRFAEAS